MSLARTSGAPEPVAPDPGEHGGQLAHCSACPPSQSVAVLLVQVLGPVMERLRSYALTFIMWGRGKCAPYLTPKFSGQPPCLEGSERRPLHPLKLTSLVGQENQRDHAHPPRPERRPRRRCDGLGRRVSPGAARGAYPLAGAVRARPRPRQLARRGADRAAFVR